MNAPALTGILADAANKNSWNLVTGAMALATDVTFNGKTLQQTISEALQNVSQSINTAIQTYDAGLNQSAVLTKLKAGTNGTDNGFYLGTDGLLHMLPERVITDGANIAAVYLPTTIVNGEVTSYTAARVVNGIIYPPVAAENNEENDEEEEEPDGDE